MFKGSFKHTITGTSAPFNSPNVEPVSIISLDIKGNKNFDDSFKALIQIEQLTGDNQHSCDGYKINATRYPGLRRFLRC
jgi:hypothetical protein